MKKLFFTFVILSLSVSYAQEVLVEKNPPEHISTIIFTADDNKQQVQFPLVRVGESFTLYFDDLNADEAVYYYRITHCDYDWKPSRLLKSEYIKGMDDQYLQPVANSYATLQPYSHYQLTLPNNLTRITLTGNYLLTINDQWGEEVFSRRFVIYNPIVGVVVDVKRARDLTFFDTKQTVQFSVKEQQMRLQNPKETVKTTILQNYRWDTAVYELKPQYTLGNELIYRYDQESAFWGGNEYFNFDNKDIRMAMTGVYRVEQNQLFEHFLFANPSRANRVYTYFPDINGNFLIHTVNGQNPSTEADYAWVHFALEAQPAYWNKEIYVYGKFSNYAITPQYQLQYNDETGLFEGKVLMKQGFYNYNFAIKEGQNIDFDTIGGNFFQTENTYLVLVYYRAPGAIYDQVIGVGAASSTNITR
ncbi:MAG: DUF5103 domain-containing protein [Capnocytophaga sp.]|nr:DUF5103 domain-containing protein [Capnocytophaga sp.]